jgi:NADP-dependent aldehyde dehydrogenase
LPSGTVQLIYRMSGPDGLTLMRDRRLAAVGFTGSKAAGLRIKQACDEAGKPAYLEMSSVNPVIFLPGAIRERSAELAQEFATSCLMGAGQFCTNPGLVILVAGAETDAFVADVRARFEAAPAGTLLSPQVRDALLAAVGAVRAAGATLLTGGAPVAGGRVAVENTLLSVTGTRFLAEPEGLQSIYTSRAGDDDVAYRRIAPLLRRKVGRLLNDKMPTGVAVSPAMNHGGPFPATGHPGFTAVGIPASLRRFSGLECYDAVRPDRLPTALQDANPTGTWRLVDGRWTTAAVTTG